MAKKSSKNRDLDSLPKEILCKNKYFKTVLLSYYTLTRNISILDAMEKIKNEDLLHNLFDEFKKYLAGFDFDIESEENEESNSLILPEHVNIKASQILSILKKPSKSGA